MKVRDVMTSPVRTVGPGSSFKAVLEQLLDADVSGLPVVDDDGRLVGIVTEADLVAKEAYQGHQRALDVLADLLTGETAWVEKAQGLTAKDLMSEPVRSVEPDRDLRAAARLMLTLHVRRLPVVENGKLVGMLARSDVLSLFHRSDDELKADVVDVLGNPLAAPEDLRVDVGVEEGIVTLTGSARCPTDVALVEAIVAKRPGVVGVTNQLIAREADAQPFTV